MVDTGNENSVADILTRNRDDFDKQVALSTQNRADLPGHYPASPERYRLFVNGTRQFFQYNDPAELNDTADGFELTPQTSGDVVTFETAEKYRYAVQYVIEWSLSLQLNQSIQSGEVLAVGYGNPDLENTSDDTPGPNADGWFVYHNSEHADTEATLAEYRNGTEVASDTIQFENLLQTFGRIGGNTNWYNVGTTTVEETYTESGVQQNEEKARVSVDDGKGPESANQRVRVSLKAKGGAGSLTADLGSIGVRVLGNVNGIVRTKGAQIEGQTVGSTGAFVPVAALRVDPNKTLVATTINLLTPTDYTGTGNLKLVGFAVDLSKTDASGFAAPPEQQADDTSIQQTTSVTTMPDSTGTETTNPTDPGGYQLGFATLQASQTGAQSDVSVGRVTKRLISENDVVVVAAFVPSSGSTGDLTFEYQTEQDW